MNMLCTELETHRITKSLSSNGILYARLWGDFEFVRKKKCINAWAKFKREAVFEMVLKRWQ